MATQLLHVGSGGKVAAPVRGIAAAENIAVDVKVAIEGRKLGSTLSCQIEVIAKGAESETCVHYFYLLTNY